MENIVEDIKNRQKSTSAYRTIGEVADILKVPQHVLRFWEGKFNQIKPKKNRGRRYYNPKDIEELKKIKFLLYEQGLTIKGVIQYLGQKKGQDSNLVDKQMHLLETTNINEQSDIDQMQKILAALILSKEKLEKI